MLSFSAVLEVSTNKLWGAHLVVPPLIAATFLDTGSQRVICTLNDTHTFQCALLPYTNGVRVISINKSIQKKLKLTLGDTVVINLAPDESEYGLPMPEEFDGILNSDADAKQYFEALTAGKKRTLLYIVDKPKSSDMKIHLGLIIAEHLKAQKGLLNYKILNQALKN